MTKNNSKEPTWKDIEEEFIEKYPYMSMLIDDDGQYVNPRAILRFFKPYFQEQRHTEAVEELESVDCQWENCSGGRYCEKHSLERLQNKNK